VRNVGQDCVKLLSITIQKINSNEDTPMEIKKVKQEEQPKKVSKTELEPIKDKDMSAVRGGRAVHVCG
jgi:hypothetical protein